MCSRTRFAANRRAPYIRTPRRCWPPSCASIGCRRARWSGFSRAMRSTKKSRCTATPRARECCIACITCASRRRSPRVSLTTRCRISSRPKIRARWTTSVRSQSPPASASSRISKRFKAAHDDYNDILLKSLADRLAEASAEALHLRVRRELWGYAPEERLTNEQLIAESVSWDSSCAGISRMPRSHGEGHVVADARRGARHRSCRSPRVSRCIRRPRSAAGISRIRMRSISPWGPSISTRCSTTRRARDGRRAKRASGSSAISSHASPPIRTTKRRVRVESLPGRSTARAHREIAERSSLGAVHDRKR